LSAAEKLLSARELDLGEIKEFVISPGSCPFSGGYIIVSSFVLIKARGISR
jgi:NADH:ubiquinone oxidoreductase subunit B-like Fe-S oxidoreductase